MAQLETTLDALARAFRALVFSVINLVQLQTTGELLAQVRVRHHPLANAAIDVGQHFVELAVLDREERVFQLALAILWIEVQELVDDVYRQRTLRVEVE